MLSAFPLLRFLIGCINILSFTALFFFLIPLQGFKYLYLTPQDYKKVSALNSVHCEHVEDEGESRCSFIFIFLYVNEPACIDFRVTQASGEWTDIIPPGTRSQTSSEKMKDWAWRIWKVPAWSLESRPWPTRRSSPWTWWGSSGCFHTKSRTQSGKMHDQEDLSRAEATAGT